MGEFGSWIVPLYYEGVLKEHTAVRTHAGLFDISHMGKFLIQGSGSQKFLEQLFPRHLSKIEAGRAIYGPLLNENGGIVDDVIIYKIHHSRFLMIVNAGNVVKDAEWISEKISEGVQFRNLSGEMGLLALQGPASPKLMGKVFGEDYKALRFYHFKEWDRGIIARTGYTGEIGYEMMIPSEKLGKIWDDILRVGMEEKVAPIGFGARDTLRLEAGLLLYGNDMNEETTPIEAGIDWAVDLSKDQYVGREALILQREKGVEKKLVGFEMIKRGIPRTGCVIRKDGLRIGKVTSGSYSPTLKKDIGLGYIVVKQAIEGNSIEVIIRDQPVQARVVRLPFYQGHR